MPEMILLQMGSTYPDLRNKLGDFDRWILSSMPSEYAELFEVIREGHSLPKLEQLKGVVISGSHSMITRPNAWERNVMRWTRDLLAADVPVLGICYGHQLLAHVRGGAVGFIPEGPELGYQRLHFAGKYERDPLFGIYPSHLEAFTFHFQTVLRLPPGAESYARSSHERHHAIRFSEWAWGVQYHPEYNAAIAEEYLLHEAAAVEKLGLDLSELMNVVRIERPQDPLIARFVDLAMSKQ